MKLDLDAITDRYLNRESNDAIIRVRNRENRRARHLEA